MATITLKIPSKEPRDKGTLPGPTSNWETDAQENIGGEVFAHDIAYNPKLKVGVIVFGERDPSTTKTSAEELRAIETMMQGQTDDFLLTALDAALGEGK